LVLAFKALAEDPDDAAAMANAVATAYVAAGTNATISQTQGATPEFLSDAKWRVKPENTSSPAEQGLERVMGKILFFLGGTGIGYAGILMERARRAKRGAAQSPSSPMRKLP